jgi:hypothetical protein
MKAKLPDDRLTALRKLPARQPGFSVNSAPSMISKAGEDAAASTPGGRRSTLTILYALPCVSPQSY